MPAHHSRENNLISKVNDAFLEPQKETQNKSILNTIHYPHQSLKIRKDMDEKAYNAMIDVLTNAKNEIGQITINQKYL